MILSSEDRNCFFEIWLGLLAFVNDKYRLVQKFGHPKLARKVKKEDVITLRKKLWEDPGIIDEYIEFARDMPHEKIETLQSWKNNRVTGDFLFVRQLKKYAVFLDTKHDKLYGVLGISNPISDFCSSLPMIMETVLLPFKEQIIYDSLINRCSVTFGSNMRQDFHEQYMEIKRRDGIITSIGEIPDRLMGKTTTRRVSVNREMSASHNKRTMAKEQMKEKQRQLREMTGTFCRQKLDEEYARLCDALIEKMGRKREVPFASGQIQIWAAAIVHAVGTVNFLFDKSFEPYIPFDEINGYFGTSKSSVGQKSKLIRDMFRMDYFNNEFLTQKLRDENPLNNMVDVDGFIVPVSLLPEDVQEMVQGLRAEGKNVAFQTRPADDDELDGPDDWEEEGSGKDGDAKQGDWKCY